MDRWQTRIRWRGAIPAMAVLIFAQLVAFACGRPPVDLSPIERAEDLRLDEHGLLARVVSEGSRAERLRAMRAMSRIQDPSFAVPLAAIVAGKDEELGREALFALGQLGLVKAQAPAPTAVAAVEKAIEEAAQGAPTLLRAALEALGKLAPDGAAEVIYPHLTALDSAVRSAAVMALFRLRFVESWRDGAPLPSELPERVTSALIERLRDEDPEVRWRAAYGFSRFGEARAVAALVPLVEDENPVARLFAVRSLGRSADPVAAASEVLAALATALTDTDSGVRTEAVEALRRLAATDERILPRAELLVEDSSLHVRAALAGALAKLPEERDASSQVDLLRRLATDDSALVRQAAIQGLATQLGPSWAAELQGYLGSEEWTDAAAAVGAARRWAAAGHIEAGRPVIEAALDHADGRVRAPAVAALGDLPGNADRIARALIDGDLAIRGSALEALTAIEHPQKRSWLRLAYEVSGGEQWIEVREALVAAVAEDDGVASTALLRRIAAQDRAPSVRAVAAARLVARGEEAPVMTALSAAKPSPFLGRRFEGNPRVVLETVRGEVEIECFAQEAPIHVANFLDLVEKGYYDGLIFHRVVSNFVVQGGDPRGDGWGGPGYTVRDEINPARYGRGAVGMPKAGKDTGGGQLFITHIPTPHLDGNYTVFGQVVRGLEVVDAIDLGDAILRGYRVER